MKSAICCSRQRGATLLEFVVAAAVLVACFAMVALIMNAAISRRAESSFDASDTVVPCKDTQTGGDRGLSANDCF